MLQLFWYKGKAFRVVKVLGSSIKNVRSNLKIRGTPVSSAQACPHLVYPPPPPSVRVDTRLALLETL